MAKSVGVLESTLHTYICMRARSTNLKTSFIHNSVAPAALPDATVPSVDVVTYERIYLHYISTLNGLNTHSLALGSYIFGNTYPVPCCCCYCLVVF